MMLRTRFGGAQAEAALARPPRQLLPLAGAGLTILMLLWVQITGPWASDLVPSALGLLGAAMLALAVLARTVQAMRQGDGMVLAVGVLAAVFSLALYGSTVAIGGSQLAFAFWTTLTGGALCVTCVRRLQHRAAAGVTPWQAMAGGAGALGERNRVLIQLSGALIGATLLVMGFTVGISWARDWLSMHAAFAFGRQTLLLLLPLLALAAVAAAVAVFVRATIGAGHPALFSGMAGIRRQRFPDSTTPTSPHHDEPAIAAHLHDSVLQTLALIGRNADDPARVKQLALQQERSLRDWLAGRDGSQADSLAAAVRLVAQEVEDEEPGVRVEVVAVGDAPLDRAADAMVRAAREAIRNAARHAGSPVRVFVEVDGAVRELFVRDTGPGFDLATVADERRGVRDAIIGRMQHVGGSAAIDSGPTGTEIALRYEDRG